MEAKLEVDLRKRLIELQESGRLHAVTLKTRLPRNALIGFINGEKYLTEQKLDELYTVVDNMYGAKPIESTQLDTVIIREYGRTSLELFKRLDRLTPEAREKALDYINSLVETKYPTSRRKAH